MLMFGSTGVVFGAGWYSTSVLLRLMVRPNAFNASKNLLSINRKFYVDAVKSIRNLVRSSDSST